MRIIAGKYKGLILEKIETSKIRPTMDRSKEALFNIIQNEIINASFLDLFAGSGNIGIEAISRGAKTVCFVDNSYEAIKVIEKNNKKIKENLKIVKEDVHKFLKNNTNKYDIIFMDPPYDYCEEELIKLIDLILLEKKLNKNGIIILEYGKEINHEKIIKSKKYGKTYFMFFKLED